MQELGELDVQAKIVLKKMVSMSLCGSWRSRADWEKALAHEQSFFCSAHKALLGTEHLDALLDWAATYRGRMEVLIRVSQYICGVATRLSADSEEPGAAYLLVGCRLSGNGPNLLVPIPPDSCA